jgi:RNA polymerase sigma-70 factor (sigma-E family)
MPITTDRGGSAGRRSAEEDEFHAFAAAFGPTLVRAAYLLLRDRDAADDVVQSTLLRTFRRWRHARSTPEAYSRRVLINVCRDHWRHQRRHPVADPANEDRLIDEGVSPAEEIDGRLALADALASLPAQQREVLVLRFFLDLSVPETAQVVGVAEGTVKSATHRGLAQLRRLLSKQFQEVPHDQ